MREQVWNFGPEDRLVGVLSTPDEAVAPDLAVVIVNAGIVHRAGPNRLHVTLARSMATNGLTSLRIDLAGIGDSEELGTADSVDEQSRVSVGAAIDALEARGIARRFVLFGLCSGAQDAFRYAAGDPRVIGIIGIDPPSLGRSAKSYILQAVATVRRPVVWYRALTGRYRLLEKLSAHRSPPTPPGVPARRERSVHRWIRRGFSALVRRNVRLLLIVTGPGGRAYNYASQVIDLFPDIGLEEIVEVLFMPASDHTFAREQDRDELRDKVLTWIDREAIAEKSAQVGRSA